MVRYPGRARVKWPSRGNYSKLLQEVSAKIASSKQKIRDFKINLQTYKILLTVIFILKLTNILLFLCIFYRLMPNLTEHFGGEVRALT